MYIYIFLSFLALINIIFFVKKVRLEFVSQIYSFFLVLGIVVLSQNRLQIVGGLLTLILCIGSVISLSFLENRNKVHIIKEQLFLLPLILIIVLEELFFRTVTYEHITSPFLFIIISGVSFGLCHIYFSKRDMIYKFFLGMMLAILYVRSNNVYLCILIHLIYNMFILNFTRRSEK
ncbi:CPBP family intramembrane glutamic endopeptidase [Enterococcus faecium]|uniref:CAAX prenyl protease 2/Lysostaphin resistance protein A-like domain-containing protein n=1 Tax=Enterococcus faecium TaxID=1352 RepID=A0A242ARW9_ENTFC|nr:CPBP family intramembrane glutamic endopeptidase [Enterococcus faecium]OTN83645.1 hypothetical protein A5810_003126 [Enterococcus faecium]